MPGSPGRWWWGSASWASAARRVSGDGRRSGAPEYGAGHRVRPEGFRCGARRRRRRRRWAFSPPPRPRASVGRVGPGGWLSGFLSPFLAPSPSWVFSVPLSPAHAAAGARPGRGRGVAGGAAHAPGSGDGAGDAAGWAAPLRGARSAAGRRPRRRAAGVHRRGQGRPAADRAGLAPVLLRRWPTTWTGAPPDRGRPTGSSSC